MSRANFAVSERSEFSKFAANVNFLSLRNLASNELFFMIFIGGRMKKIFKIILTFIKVRYFSKWTSRDKLLEYQKKTSRKTFKIFKRKFTIF